MRSGQWAPRALVRIAVLLLCAAALVTAVRDKKFYKILDVDEKASEKDIKKAYKKAALCASSPADAASLRGRQFTLRAARRCPTELNTMCARISGSHVLVPLPVLLVAPHGHLTNRVADPL